MQAQAVTAHNSEVVRRVSRCRNCAEMRAELQEMRSRLCLLSKLVSGCQLWFGDLQLREFCSALDRTACGQLGSTTGRLPSPCLHTCSWAARKRRNSPRMKRKNGRTTEDRKRSQEVWRLLILAEATMIETTSVAAATQLQSSAENWMALSFFLHLPCVFLALLVSCHIHCLANRSIGRPEPQALKHSIGLMRQSCRVLSSW